jgi:hypothetical protein
MAAPTPRLSAKIRHDFSEPGAAEALIENLASLDADERVQAAIVIWAAGDLSRFRDSLAVAQVDWRDVLVRAGLENEDWPAILDQQLGQ